jgi:hypothetical protein
MQAWRSHTFDCIADKSLRELGREKASDAEVVYRTPDARLSRWLLARYLFANGRAYVANRNVSCSRASEKSGMLPTYPSASEYAAGLSVLNQLVTKDSSAAKAQSWRQKALALFPKQTGLTGRTRRLRLRQEGLAGCDGKELKYKSLKHQKRFFSPYWGGSLFGWALPCIVLR